MFGKSVYVSQVNDDLKLDKECQLYFTSFHIAEEFDEDFRDRAFMLLKLIRQNGSKVIVDLSPRGLKALGFSSLRDFVETRNIDYVRFDFGFSEEEIADASRYCGVVINASTADEKFIRKLQGDVIAIHNYYPRRETGLDWAYFRERNEIIRRAGIKVGAFIAGDENLRGPLHEGLPTLESHRCLKPYVQYAQLRKEVDLIITGDTGITHSQQALIYQSERDDILRLPAYINKEYEYLYDTVFTNRPDSPAWLIRIRESREYASAGKTVAAKQYALPRSRGSITIDNEKYLRYSGEIQVMKNDLPVDERVNVIGHVEKDYENLLECIKRNERFMFSKL